MKTIMLDYCPKFLITHVMFKRPYAETRIPIRTSKTRVQGKKVLF